VSFSIGLDVRVAIRTVMVQRTDVANSSAMRDGATSVLFGARAVSLLPSSIQNQVRS
jgi:hypothetical protein